MPEPRVAILGGGGAVGRLLRGAFRATFPDVSVFVQSSKDPSSDLICNPLMDGAEAVVTALATFRPDVVAVLWGATPAGDADLGRNVQLAQLALDAAALTDVPRTVLLSTAAVYGGVAGVFREQDVPEDTNPYGASKLAMEVEALRAGLRGTIVFRAANVVGADALSRATRNATEDAPLLLDRFSDQTSPRRSYLSPVTLARTVLEVPKAVAEPPRILNLADNADGIAMSDMLAALEGQGRHNYWKSRPAPQDATSSLTLDLSALHAAYPALVGHARSDAAGLVADWLAAEEALR
ncbi:NAD-dependent epimerase/dehydratase family protein [Qingshengfaniella alkalisoli]|uniref:NAD(P)-dependent oxidoreductase n=1 Tax=Qingshengfaniella alkalisoli TaxID=2599296 RepID=A0A5B8IVG5_9RHOB|nr:NAD(P)-dependent oxidoreductase [Qingshengfaniella alkalisoli]QDY70102.1 NAD(P)-dependent oxidoreductase [Qingshengfaniella alkalisoli]